VAIGIAEGSLELKEVMTKVGDYFKVQVQLFILAKVFRWFILIFKCSGLDFIHCMISVWVFFSLF